MTTKLIDRPGARTTPVPVHFVASADFETVTGALNPAQKKWLESSGFSAAAGRHVLVPGQDGAVSAVIFCVEDPQSRKYDPFLAGKLAKALPKGVYALAGEPDRADLAALGWLLAGYEFTRYSGKASPAKTLVSPSGTKAAGLKRIADGVFLARDLINTPANDMGPAEIEKAVRDLAAKHKAKVRVTKGDALLKNGFPLIHAVGRASTSAPRLIDMTWGRAGDPRVTLVGKGVSFDTGGLNLKPGSSMSLMKKDMGGAANVIGLASMIMAAKLKVRLRLLVPAVENAVAGNAFRPGDVYPSRKGLTVEIGNTDAEGRLVLADALTLADDEKPDLLVDMATLTGAARVALGPDLPPYYTDDEDLAAAIAAHSAKVHDPLWRMPFWNPYDGWLSSQIADVNHITEGGFAGSVTAALFLRRFVERTRAYVHFDIFGWTPKALPARPRGGAAQGIRALYSMLEEKHG